MTREEAIAMLKSKMDGSVDTSYEWAEAVRMAIEALQDEAPKPTGGLIARADAIEAVMAEGRKVYTSEYASAERIIYEADAVEALSMLPSADAVSREVYEETDGVVTIEKQNAKEVGEIKHIVIRSPNYTRYFYNESMPLPAEAVDIHLPDYSFEAGMVQRLAKFVHGKWNEDCACSVCGCQPWYEHDIHTLNFCPNCGADMRGEE